MFGLFDRVYDGGVSAIVAITSNGTVNCKVTQDTVNSDEFKDFIEGLLPMLIKVKWK